MYKGDRMTKTILAPTQKSPIKFHKLDPSKNAETISGKSKTINYNKRRFFRIPTPSPHPVPQKQRVTLIIKIIYNLYAFESRTNNGIVRSDRYVNSSSRPFPSYRPFP